MYLRQISRRSRSFTNPSRLAQTLTVSACVNQFPPVAYAQASLAGTARDTSGAVLPGVTVEAASSVLIEKARTAVTDGQLSGRAS
jgi:hypothetical protein